MLHGPDYLPDGGARPADARAQMFSSSPTGGAESMQLMYLLVITAATQDASTSRARTSFPTSSRATRWSQAMKRGVRFRLIVPGPIIDTDVVRRASRSTWGPLLAAGAEIHEYQPTMFHCKVLIVDGLLVSVGSTNFDPRSFRLNDEANLNVYDRDVYDRTSRHSRKSVFEQRHRAIEARHARRRGRTRPWHEKLMEHAAAPACTRNSRKGNGMNGTRHFSMIRGFHLADFLTLGNAACGVAAECSARWRTGASPAIAYFYAAALLAPAAFVFDVLDGRVARSRQQHSALGRELDSLADVISFGVAPAALGIRGRHDRRHGTGSRSCTSSAAA